jgi:DNA-3-methyladenine glycosylase
MTARNRALFLERGHAYVYVAYGISRLLNVTSEAPGVGAGVLLRAVEPTEGLAFMQGRRGGAAVIDLARGPGRLTLAMGIELAHDGVDLCDAGALRLEWAERPPGEIGTSVRIGISRAIAPKLRFYERRSRFVSGPASLRA